MKRVDKGRFSVHPLNCKDVSARHILYLVLWRYCVGSQRFAIAKMLCQIVVAKLPSAFRQFSFRIRVSNLPSCTRQLTMLLAAMALLALGQPGGQLRYHLAAGVDRDGCVLDKVDFAIAFANAHTSGPQSPVTPEPQPHELHHDHSQLAIPLLLIVFLPPLIVLWHRTPLRLLLLQPNLRRPSPPPRWAHRLSGGFAS